MVTDEPRAPEAAPKRLSRTTLLRQCALSILAAAAALSLLATTDSSASAGAVGERASSPVAVVTQSTGAIAGDLDCDDDIDVVDAVLVLRRVAALTDAADCGSADVNCSGRVDSVDALALLRSAARLPALPLPAGCAGIDIGNVKHLLRIDSLECEPESVLPHQTTECSFEAGSSGSYHTMGLNAPDGNVVAGPRALSAACPPNDLPCTFGSSGVYFVSFPTPGERIVTLTVCSAGFCESQTVQVTVAAPE